MTDFESLHDLYDRDMFVLTRYEMYDQGSIPMGNPLRMKWAMIGIDIRREMTEHLLHSLRTQYDYLIRKRDELRFASPQNCGSCIRLRDLEKN